MNKIHGLSLFCILLLLFILSSCATIKYGATGINEQLDREKIVEYSYKLLGKKDLSMLGKSFRNDCSGFVLGVFNNLGYRIQLDYSYPTGKITKLLYINLSDNGFIYRNKYPRIADVAFFRSTVQGDRGITHIALVVNTNQSGNIMMLHYGSKGVMELRMNLRNPSIYKDHNGNILNDFLLKDSINGNNKRLSGELFYCFGDLLGYLN